MTAPIFPTVFVIDDQPDELLLIRERCEAIGLQVRTYQSPLDFLEDVSPDLEGCVVADLLMPQMTGLQLNSELRRRGVRTPMVVVTGHADASTCRVAFQSGVFDFVEKSFNPNELLNVIQAAVQKNREDLAALRVRNTVLSRLAEISPREKDVMYQLAEGKSLKEIATAFDISVQTASKHRGSLFKKLGVANEVELLKLLIAIDPNHGTHESTPAA